MADIDELQPGSKANLGYTNGYTSFYTAVCIAYRLLPNTSDENVRIL